MLLRRGDGGTGVVGCEDDGGMVLVEEGERDCFGVNTQHSNIPAPPTACRR